MPNQIRSSSDKWQIDDNVSAPDFKRQTKSKTHLIFDLI